MAQHTTSAKIVRLPNRSHDWTQQELGEFYRVENALTQAGLIVACDRGISDEGDPWYIFFRETDHEPLVHFARIDGYYTIASAAYGGVAKGKNFREMILDLLERHQLNKEKFTNKSNVLFHPAALLIMLVGVAFFKAPSSAKANENHNSGVEDHVSGELITSKPKGHLAYSTDIKSWAQTITPTNTALTDEMTSILLLALTELTTTSPAAGAEPSHGKTLYNNPTTADTLILPSHSTSTNAVQNNQKVASEQFSNPSSAVPIIQMNGTDTSEIYPVSVESEAHLLVNLLNNIPLSSEHNVVSVLSSLVKLENSHVSLLKPSANIAHIENSFSYTNTRSPITEITKSTQNTQAMSDKEAKTNTLEPSKQSDISNHSANTLDSGNNTPAIVSSPLKPDIEYKISLNSGSQTALVVINQLNQSYHFSNETGVVTTKLIEQASISSISLSPINIDSVSNSLLPKLDNTENNYSLNVLKDTIQSYSKSGHENLSSEKLSGSQIEVFLGKFLHMFTDTTFSSEDHNTFVFQTNSSLASNGQLEQITINFQDGSNINIIGQKMEIDSLMSLS